MDQVLLQPARRRQPITALFLGVEADPRFEETMIRMEQDKLSPGRSDVGIRNMLFSLIASTRPYRILEIGAHIGMATLVLARGCQLAGFGRVVTVEPNDKFFSALTSYIDAAGLKDFITVLKGFSYDDAVIERIRNEGEYQLVFIDALHAYRAVLSELEFVSSILSQNGFIVLHDTSVHAMEYDQEKMGGVRRAVREFCATNQEFKPIFFEYPLWLNRTGMAIVCKQKLE